VARWAGLATVVRAARRSDPGVSMARLLQTWLGADHGWRPSTVAGYRSLGWAYTERILDRCPLDLMRGPPVPRTRSHVPVAQVVELLGYAERAASAQTDLLAGDQRAGADVHRAEQVLLLCRLAADTGARRGELAALQLGDLDGRVLTLSEPHPVR